MYEPHTISFSTQGQELWNIIQRSKFAIKAITYDRDFHADRAFDDFPDNSIACVCYKP